MKRRDYQDAAIKTTLSYCKRTQGNPLIVLPTGSGKSFVISELAEEIHALIPTKKILVLAHRKELVEQNAAKFNMEVGIFHAGIGRKDTDHSIIVGGIQSVYNSLDAFKDVGAVIVDECDLVSFDEDSMYRKTLDHFGVRTIGLTATPYRLDGGMLYIGDDAYFDQVIYEKPLREMIDNGYLCKLVSKVSDKQPDLNNVQVRMGDFVASQLEEAMIDPELIKNSVESILKYSDSRNKCLLFSPSIKHAEILKQLIPTSEVVTGELSMKERERILSDFHLGKFKYLINVDVLTVGFDEPAIDCIAMLRPTKSTRLYVQMVGRGLRTAEGKEDCLVLDYAGNIREHGAIDKVKVQFNPKTGKAEAEKHDSRICPVCESLNEMSNDECFECGYVLKEVRSVNHTDAPDDIDINASFIEPQWHNITGMSYNRHKGKNGKQDSLKCEYTCFMNSYSEWLCVEHKGFAYVKAMDTLADRWRGTKEPFDFANSRYSLTMHDRILYDDSLITLLEDNHEEVLKRPTRIRIDLNEKYPRIIGYDYTTIEGRGHTNSSSEEATGDQEQFGVAFL